MILRDAIIIGWRRAPFVASWPTASVAGIWPARRLQRESPEMAVRPEGANHQWRKIPPRELSIDLVADERLGRVTGRAGAS